MKKKIIFGILIVLFVFTGMFFLYVNDDYDASEEALLALTSTETVHVSGKDPVRFTPEKEQKNIGIIYYPGGKVEEEAYAPLMQQLADEGYTVFLVDMPFGLAVFDINAAEAIIENHPEITEWYLAGHSLGGSMAAIFAENHADKLAGLILLASYSTADLSQSGMPVLSIQGSEDQVIDQEKIAEYRSMLPEEQVEVVIEGGNHAQFGNYGEQSGDGKAAISAGEQQRITVDEITQFIKMGK